MSTLFEGLGPKIKAQYKAGIAKKAVIYTESEVEEADEEGIPVRVSLSAFGADTDDSYQTV